MAKPPQPPADTTRPSPRRRFAERALLGLIVVAAAGAGVVAFLIWQQSAPETSSAAAKAPPAQYVGHAACGSCHQSQADAWRGSQHAQAMQPATPATIGTHPGPTGRLVDTHELFAPHNEGARGLLRELGGR